MKIRRRRRRRGIGIGEFVSCNNMNIVSHCTYIVALFDQRDRLRFVNLFVLQQSMYSPCVPMRERHECHCMLFLTEDNDFAGEERVSVLYCD